MKKQVFALLFFITLFLSACSHQKEAQKTDGISIAVFLPGIRAESPIYAMLADGVEQAVAQAQADGKKVSLSILEAGVNQAQWALKLAALAAEQEYDVIISSNPSMPALVMPILEQFPEQHFLLFDAYDGEHPNIATFQYNQSEQAWLAGTMAALVSTSNMAHANRQKKIGLISGQEYPAMMNVILPAYRAGAQSIDPGIEVDFRIVGSWSDAAKGAELARAMYRDGVDVIMPICGGANQGVVSAAQDELFYVAWFDDNGYAKAPGLVIASSVLEQTKLVCEQTLRFIEGKTEFGKHSVFGLREGYINFVQDDPLYIDAVPLALREQQKKVVQAIASGELEPGVMLSEQ